MPPWIPISLATLITLGAAELTGAAPGRAATIGTTITAAAGWAGVFPELLAAVTWVESRGNPLALGIAGRALNPRDHKEAVALLQAVRGQADIGLAQIHYPIWGPVFGLRPEDLLDPWTNLHVAAAILRYAMDQEPGSWGGVGRYHSATPWRKWWYARSVAMVFRALRAPMIQSDRGATP
jgi:soluble lytic murein transglycosylase-like protein